MEISVSVILTLFGGVLSTVVGAVVYLYKLQEKDKSVIQADLAQCHNKHESALVELREVMKQCGELSGKIEVLEKFASPQAIVDAVVSAVQKAMDARN